MYIQTKKLPTKTEKATRTKERVRSTETSIYLESLKILASVLAKIEIKGEK